MLRRVQLLDADKRNCVTGEHRRIRVIPVEQPGGAHTHRPTHKAKAASIRSRVWENKATMTIDAVTPMIVAASRKRALSNAPPRSAPPGSRP